MRPLIMRLTDDYSFTVTASDGNGSSATGVTVNVNDVNENTTPVVPPTPTVVWFLILVTESYQLRIQRGDWRRFGCSTRTIKEIDGTTDRTMLVVGKD